jgi:hypothetical protein
MKPRVLSLKQLNRVFQALHLNLGWYYLHDRRVCSEGILSWRHDAVVSARSQSCLQGCISSLRTRRRRACSEENWSCRHDGTDLKYGTNTRGTANLVRTFGYR